MNPGTTQKTYFPVLDGLRGLAILLVIFHHNFKFVEYFFFGWLGVDLFFVLSGFLITDILLNGLGSPNYLRNFYARRILRIFPVYYGILMICLFILPFVNAVQLDFSFYQQHQLWMWTYFQNWLFVFHEPANNKILLHTWSLAVEEQFYLVWPAIILLVKKPRVLLYIAGGILLLVILARLVLWMLHLEGFAYGNFYTFTRIDGICVGCIVALLLRVNPGFLKKYATLIVLSFATLNFGFYFLIQGRSKDLPYLAIIGYTTFAMLFGMLVYYAVSSKNKILGLLFNNKVMKFFGKISYGLYVYHWPVYLLLFPYFRKQTQQWASGSVHLPEILSGIAVTLIAILISIVSYRFFEMPFLKLKKKFS